MITDFNLQILIEPLLNWFAGHARVLPWREEPTPYRVWVSEIMLQQTRVEAVKPYFERFTKRLPDVKALAECPEDELLKLWEGLGYYNRVRNMQKAAIQVMEEYGGKLNDFRMVGSSIHSPEEAIRAQKAGAAYVTAGHVYVTDCKKGLPPRGLEFLKEVCTKVTIPVYAIGGIHAGTGQIQEVMDCGASGGCIMSEMMRI